MRYLLDSEIDEFASWSNVNQQQVEGFLSSMGDDSSLARCNLSFYARYRSWSTEIVAAIEAGIIAAEYPIEDNDPDDPDGF